MRPSFRSCAARRRGSSSTRTQISPWLKHAIVASRGQALLRAPRRRPSRHGARALGRRHQPRHRAGRLDDHAAVRQERLPDEPEDDRPQALRGRARLAARAEVVEGPDPDRLPEHRLLRERRLRRRAGVAHLLPPPGRADEAGGGGPPRGDPRGPEPLGPGRAPEGGQGAPQPRPAPALPAGLHHAQPVRRRQGRSDARPDQGQPALDAGRRRAVLRELRQGPARQAVRPEPHVRRRPARDDDARRRPAEARARRDRVGAARVGAVHAVRADRRDGRPRRAERLRARDGRRRELPPEPVQPRDAGRAPARLVVQAVRARDRAQGGHRPVEHLHLVQARDDQRRTAGSGR